MNKNAYARRLLWGGAVAAHQLEGGWQEGVSVSIADVMTAGDKDHPRRVTDGVKKVSLPNHWGIDFTIVIQKTSSYLLKWDSNVSDINCLDTNLPNGDETEPNEEDSNFMMTYLMSY